MERSELRVFNPKALWVARSFRELTQSELAEKAGVSRQTVNAIETGGTQPFRHALLAIADSLRFPIEFFGSHQEVPSRDVFHFRRGARVPEYALDRAAAHAALFASVAVAFGSFATFAKTKLPSAEPKDADRIERAAEAFRTSIAVRTDAPLANAIRAAEAAGIFVSTFDPGPVPIDGFACASRVPMLMISNTSSWSRRRFSTMHEVGHLVLHRRSSHEDKEEHANRFASAVLVPRPAFWREFPRPIERRFDWAALIAMKQRWGISIQALIYRAYDLGLIDAAQFRTANIHIAKYGWKTAEPAELPAEEPAVCAGFVSELRRRDAVPALCAAVALSLEDVGRAIGVSLEPEPERSSVIRIGKRPRA